MLNAPEIPAGSLEINCDAVRCEISHRSIVLIEDCELGHPAVRHPLRDLRECDLSRPTDTALIKYGESQ